MSETAGEKGGEGEKDAAGAATGEGAEGSEGADGADAPALAGRLCARPRPAWGAVSQGEGAEGHALETA